MKRTFFTTCICLLSVWAAGAQSTCETRVDAHPHASTMQRVNYCLNQPAQAQPDNPGLVFSGVTVRHPQEDPTPQKPSAREGHFNQDKISVQRTFVGTDQFPAFKNNTLSEREIWMARQQQGVTEQPASVESAVELVRQPVERQMEPLDELVTETTAGLKARKTKPGRQLREVVAQEESLTVTDLTQPVSQEETLQTDAYTYDSTNVQPYAPASPDAQEYVPAVQDAQDYVPAQQTAQPYVPAEQTEIPVGTSSYAPAN